MNHFPDNDHLPQFDLRQHNARAWLAESTETLLFQDEECDNLPLDPTLSDGAILPPPYTRDPDTLKPGSVRLLSNFQHADIKTHYVLILGEWTPGYPIIIPFSPYSSPATESELHTNLKDDAPLQVLQIWNSRSCPWQLLSESWHVCQLDDSLVNAAKQLFLSAHLGQDEIPTDLLPHIGTSIVKETDPRIPYLDTQMDSLSPLHHASLNWHALTSTAFPEMQDEEEELKRENEAGLPPQNETSQSRDHSSFFKSDIFSSLALADDGEHITCIRINTPFTSLMQCVIEEGELDLSALNHPSETFSAAITMHPERIHTEEDPHKKNLHALYRPLHLKNEDSISPGMPFLILLKKETVVAALGQVDEDGNLEVHSGSDLFIQQNPKNLLIILPNR